MALFFQPQPDGSFNEKKSCLLPPFVHTNLSDVTMQLPIGADVVSKTPVRDDSSFVEDC
jgi:hypothetical protein